MNHRTLLRPEPTDPPGGRHPPTTPELARLIEEAAAGSKVARAALDQLVTDHQVTAKRLADLEKKFEESKQTPPPAAPAKSSSTPWFWGIGRKEA